MAFPAGWVGLVLGDVTRGPAAASMTVWMRPLSLDAVSGARPHSGFNTASTSAVPISSTGLSRIGSQ
jgi:hypothetical protein